MEVTQMSTTYSCPHCKHALKLLENQINTNVHCSACGKWFFASSTPSNEHPSTSSSSTSADVSSGGRKLNPIQRVTDSTQFLFAMCAVAGLMIAGIIGFFIWQDTEKASNSPVSNNAPIAEPVLPNPPGPPEAKKISDAEISTSKPDVSAPNPELKNPTVELETRSSEDQSGKAEAKANNPE